MSTSDDAPRPLVDQSVLDRLRDELEEEEGYSRVFVGNFIDFLPAGVRYGLATGFYRQRNVVVVLLKYFYQLIR